MAEAKIMTEEDVCNAIRDRVLEQRLAPGTKLTEESLCTIFGVGRTTIRRAFLLLTRDNIIELQKNKGAVVATPTPEAAEQVFEARLVLEQAMLEKAVQTATSADIQSLRQHVHEEATALQHADIARWIRLTGEFHLKVASLSGNKPMISFLQQLVFQSSLIIALYGRKSGGKSCKGGDHEDIVAAIEAGDTPAASSILMRHLDAIQHQLCFETSGTEEDLYAIFSSAAIR